MKTIILSVIILFFGILFVGGGFSKTPNDWLNKTFKFSHKPPVSDKPYVSDIEADDMFNTNASITIGGPNSGVGTSDSVLVSLARFLMRIGVMLGVPLLIFGAIKIALSFGDQGKLAESIKLIGYMVGGLLLILLSVMIIFLVTSLTRSSLSLFVE